MIAKKFYVGLKGLVHDPERGVLLMHRTDENYQFWELPGGRINEDESFEQTLKRELEEEVPTIGSIAVGEVLGAFKVNREFAEGFGLVQIYFSVTATLPDPIILSSEHDGHAFYTKNGEIPEPINPVVRELLTRFYE